MKIHLSTGIVLETELDWDLFLQQVNKGSKYFIGNYESNCRLINLDHIVWIEAPGK